MHTDDSATTVSLLHFSFFFSFFFYKYIVTSIPLSTDGDFEDFSSNAFFGPLPRTFRMCSAPGRSQSSEFEKPQCYIIPSQSVALCMSPINSTMSGFQMNGFNLLKPVCRDTHVSAHSGCAKKTSPEDCTCGTDTERMGQTHPKVTAPCLRNALRIPSFCVIRQQQPLRTRLRQR